MSPPPHRERHAKVEGRDPQETGPRETMAPFKSLLGRLLKVKPEDVAEQMALYESEKSLSPLPIKKKASRLIGALKRNAGQRQEKAKQ